MTSTIPQRSHRQRKDTVSSKSSTVFSGSREVLGFDGHRKFINFEALNDSGNPTTTISVRSLAPPWQEQPSFPALPIPVGIAVNCGVASRVSANASTIRMPLSSSVALLVLVATFFLQTDVYSTGFSSSATMSILPCIRECFNPQYSAHLIGKVQYHQVGIS